jgi:Lysyl oxidase
VVLVSVGGVFAVSRATGQTAPGPAVVDAMSIAGVVYRDSNRNGRIDTGEPPIRKAPIRVRNPLTHNEQDVTTDSNGAFKLAVGALAHVVVSVLLEGRAPTRSSAVVPFRVNRSVAAGEVIEIAVSPGPRSCSVPATCAGLLLPDLVSLDETPAFLDEEAQREYIGPTQWSIDRKTSPGRALLRIATISANVGAGPLVVLGVDQRDGVYTGVVQRLFDRSGGYLDTSSGTFEFSKSHKHVHLEAFEEIRLIGTNGQIASARKLSFCLTDVLPTAPEVVEAPISIDLKLFDCGVAQQGINVGMADYYGPALPDQFVDVTGLADGDYTVEIAVDPDDVIVEADESNNLVRFKISLSEVTL